MLTCTSQCNHVGHKGTPRNAGQVISTQIQWLIRPSHSVNDASGPNDLGQRKRAVADLDGLAQRRCAGLGPGTRSRRGKLVRTPWNTYPPRIGACKSDDAGRDEGEADPYEMRVGGSESTGHGNASHVTSGQAGENEGGCPRQGLRGGTLAAAEHACSTPWSKWSAECEKNALSTDAPEGVVVELKEGVRVQPFSCSGATSGKCTHRKADK